MKKHPSKPAGKRRILIADDHPLFREGLVQLINRERDLSCCGETGTVAATQTAAARLKPDLLVLDLRLKNGDGLELIKSLKARFPDLFVLVLSEHDETLYAERAVRAGAKGYLMKEEALGKIVTAIRRVLDGAIYVSDALAAKMLQQQVRGQKDIHESPVKGLSDREMEVFQLIGRWKKTKDIAQEFNTEITDVTFAILLTLAMRPIGAYLFGRAADRWGRRPTLMIDVLLYSIIEFASGFSPDLTALLVLRAMFGKVS